MEATGVYHEVAALALFGAGATVSIANPAQVKDFAKGLAVRTKTDSVDGFVLARFGAMLNPPARQPPPCGAFGSAGRMDCGRRAPHGKPIDH